MTFATTHRRKYNTCAFGHIPQRLVDFPTEIVRLIFEASVTPGRRADDDQERQRTAYACCLVSKEVKAWMEPMLYEKVVLESSDQVMAFLDALESKSAEFLARTVKTVWILNNSFPEKAVDRFRCLFSACISLRRFACLGNEPCGKLLQFIPKPQNGSHALQELTIIQPGEKTAFYLDLSHLSIQRIQIIDGYVLYAMALSRRAFTDKMFGDALREIPHISFDFLDVPRRVHSCLIQRRLIRPLLTRGMPGQKAVFVYDPARSRHKLPIRVISTTLTLGSRRLMQMFNSTEVDFLFV